MYVSQLNLQYTIHTELNQGAIRLCSLVEVKAIHVRTYLGWSEIFKFMCVNFLCRLKAQRFLKCQVFYKGGLQKRRRLETIDGFRMADIKVWTKIQILEQICGARLKLNNTDSLYEWKKHRFCLSMKFLSPMVSFGFNFNQNSTFVQFGINSWNFLINFWFHLESIYLISSGINLFDFIWN